MPSNRRRALRVQDSRTNITRVIHRNSVKDGQLPRSFSLNAALKIGSVIVTANTITAVFSKAAEVVEPMGYVAMDTNERGLEYVTGRGGFSNMM